MTDLAPSFRLETPAGEDRERRVCDHCGWVDYRNPRIVVGSVVTWTPPEPGAEPLILMCRRAIEPRRGFWTLPAGFMETGETAQAAAAREAQEEAECAIRIDALLAVYDVVHVQQVQLMFRATLAEPVFAAGPESLDVRLYAWAEIPWDEIAFPSLGAAPLARGPRADGLRPVRQPRAGGAGARLNLSPPARSRGTPARSRQAASPRSAW